MSNLTNYGWDKYIRTIKNKPLSSSNIARVTSIRGTKYILVGLNGELEAELSGRLLYSLEAEFQPKTGDWVNYLDYDSQAIIIEVLPRINSLFRKSAGNSMTKQVIASNIDFAVVIQGLDNNFNLMRLERYLAQIIACKITPVIILNKVDLVDNKSYYENEIRKLNRKLPVYFCSTISEEGMASIKEVFQAKSTFVLIGSSGVGKSSILNTLNNGIINKTAAISENTGKGKHTTTTRELYRMPNGSLIIDTPGMREFGIGFGDDFLEDDIFPHIAEYGKNCKYNNCQHLNENGCNVLEAVENNEIDPVVYNSYVKLIREQHELSKSKAEKNREGKQFGKMIREAKNYRKKYKF